jgi:KipI family sensor histidine kinase inhibitor
VNARAIAIATAIRAARLDGVRDVMPTFRSVAVYFDPGRTSAVRLRAGVEAALDAPVVPVFGREVEVPVVYGGQHGPDLDGVAGWARLEPSEVVERHARQVYRVYMTGFLPGFPYMGPVDPAIAMPRRATPRLRVPAGSVGIAGPQTGIYPSDAPGGWNLVGRTPLRLFDAHRTPSVSLSPGDRVRFVPVASEGSSFSAGTSGVEAEPASPRELLVLRPGLVTTVQDLGRWGHQAVGVPVGGSLDRDAHVRANRLVGNPPAEALLEATIQGPELRLSAPASVAVSGADLGVTLDGADLPLDRAARCDAGAMLRFARRRSGARAYMAFGGGIAVRPTLGSRSTHVGAGLGPFGGRALKAGDVVPLGEAATSTAPAAPRASYGDRGARVRVLPGPQEDFFPPSALDVLQRTRFTVSPQSNRMGYRLEGERVPRIEGREMISDATFTGAIQVPTSGDPILLLADRQTTGGYPQIAVVITADLPRLAQLAPGDWIEFQLCSETAAQQALATLEPGAS